MSFQSHVLQVLFASPSDTKEARDETEKSLHGWNGSRAEREQVILLPRRWETDSVPVMGNGDGQEIINSQLVEKSDIVVVIFNSKIGQATARALSGTVEELEKAVADGKRVHVYFSDAPVSRDSLESAQEVEAFKRTLESKGLYGSYSDPTDLGFKVRQAIESDLEHLNLAIPSGRPTRTGADPVAKHAFDREQHFDSRNKMSYRNRNHRLIVENHGDTGMENFTFEMTSLDDDVSPEIYGREVAPSIPAKGEYAWILSFHMGSSQSVQMDMKWEENGVEKTKTQSVSLL
ncbi:hypothetical protein ACX80Z_15430 [Arthrobacter sp. TMT4-20]